MAIVDKTHSQTIEEAFNSVAEGGSGGGTSQEEVEEIIENVLETKSYATENYVNTVASEEAPKYIK